MSLCYILLLLFLPFIGCTCIPRCTGVYTSCLNNKCDNTPSEPVGPYDPQSSFCAVYASLKIYLIFPGIGYFLKVGEKANGTWTEDYVLPGGSQTRTSPAAVSWGNGRIDLLYRDLNSSALMYRFYNGDVWSSIMRLGVNIQESPSVTSRAVGYLDAAVLDTNYNLLVSSYSSGKWGSWSLMRSPSTKTSPAIVASSTDQIDLFIIGTDGFLYHKYKIISRGRTYWTTTWENLGSSPGLNSSRPSVISSQKYIIDVVVKGVNNDIQYKWYNGSTWYDWVSFGQSITYDPTIMAKDSGMMSVFFVHQNGSNFELPLNAHDPLPLQ